MKQFIPQCLYEVLLRDPLVLADAGAAGGIHDRWSLLKDGLKVLGFEPDSRAFEELNSTAGQQWINAALGECEGELTLRVTRHQTNTSLLEPNYALINRVHKNPSDFDVVREVVVTATTLDKASADTGLSICALKIDTQGSELSILRGAQNQLAGTLHVVEIEVEFAHLYQGQPLFGDVDAFMRDRGFVLIDLGNLTYQKWNGDGAVGGRKGQLIAADALYFRSPESLSDLALKSGSGIVYLAHYWAACAAYGYAELALEAALLLDQSGLIPDGTVDELRAFERGLRSPSMVPSIRGRGRLASLLRSFANKVEPRAHSVWINPLGNR